MMIKFALTVVFSLCLFNSFSVPVHEEASISKLKNNLVKNLLENKRTDDRFSDGLNQLKEDGSFSDVNYQDKTSGNWKAYSHLGHLLGMAIQYKSPQSTYYNNQEFKKKVFKVLDYWLKNDFSNPNWWYQEIGTPQALGQAMVLLKDELSAEELESGLKILNRANIKFTGQNKVWLSGNVVYRSVLTNDNEMIKKAATSISDEIMISENEGIQQDYSFHQHGHQLQFGNYGLSYGSDMVKWASIFEGTEYAFDPAKIEILRGYLRNGLRWMVWNARFDINGCGRQLFQNAQIGKARSVAAIFKEAQAADPAFAEKYNTDLQNLAGNAHFWRSDLSVHRRPEFYASVKMSSNRVKGYEIINGENIQGYHTGDGATIYYQSGDEYTDIFPFWDWKRIPGTTAWQDNEKLPMTNDSKNKSDFVGGVSDGMNGIAVLNVNRDSLTANKSWFFYNDAIICLGAGITGELEKDAATTVNQSLLKGPVLVFSNGKAAILPKGNHELKNVTWILHDHWGYYFPDSPALNLQNQQRSGAWNRVVAPMPSTELTTDIFQLCFDHGIKPSDASYAYFVFPAANKNNLPKRANEIKIIANTKDLQAVSTKDYKFSGVVFYKSGTIQLGSLKISSSSPCVALLTSAKKKLQLSVSDPTHLQKELELKLSGRIDVDEGGKAEYDRKKDLTRILVPLPVKGYAGKSITLNLNQ